MIDYAALPDLRRIKANINRLSRARKLVEKARKVNEVSDLDLTHVCEKLERAERELSKFFGRLCEKSGWGDGHGIQVGKVR
jgi:hypothetical protein